MRAVLCNSCSHVDVNKIAKNLNCDVEIVETCTEVNADLVSCPVLSSDAKVVDLRLVERVFHNPEKVASSWMNSELITSSPEYDVIETGYEIVYVGSNPEVVRVLSEAASVAVVTESEEAVTELYPFRHRIFYGRVRNITGELGRLKVTVEGEDLLKEEQGIFEIECGMAIVPPEVKWSNTGLIKHENEFRSVTEAILRLGSVKVAKSVKIDANLCATEKSGISGCTFCLRCPNASVRRENGRIVVDHLSCLACGYCTSVCPTGAAQSSALPFDALIEKIDLAQSDTIVFICEKALGDLYSLSRKGVKLPEAHIITVPCLNYVSDVHYLYAVLKGSHAVGVPCECGSGMYGDFVDLANEVLSAFGYPEVEITDVNGLSTVLHELKNKRHPGGIIERADGSGRVLMAAMLARLSSLEVRSGAGRISTDRFAEISISDSCTFCKTCQAFCPTGAIRREPDESRIYFNHALCISCRLCERACPERAITVEQGLNLEKLSEFAVFETEMVECPSCGKKHISRKAHEKLSQILGLKVSTMYCEECRPKMILETVYNELKGDGK